MVAEIIPPDFEFEGNCIDMWVNVFQNSRRNGRNESMGDSGRWLLLEFGNLHSLCKLLISRWQREKKSDSSLACLEDRGFADHSKTRKIWKTFTVEVGKQSGCRFRKTV